ncbi:MAG: caspase family protein [Archangiaceae bacterium]|nr:caspase family protein [Archangiaceae bacterium]
MKAGLALSLLILAAPLAAAAQTRRIAIVVGSNAGSDELPPLRYAETDAGKMARVLVELGEVAPDDLLLLQGRTAADLERAFVLARARLTQHWAQHPRSSAVMMFYFSGHSDGESVELGAERVSYARVRALLEGTGADVRIAVVDACKSGGGLRTRGGRPAEGFEVHLTDALQSRGEVFISSSSEAELAHESNEVMGGFFTHHFVSGLRGAADVNADKRVTLYEAYRYAYERTLSATELLDGRGQHATFDYRLSGRGELTLTQLSSPPALVALPDAQRVLITDLARDQVVAEVLGDAPRELSLAPGRYSLTVTRDGQTRGARIVLAPNAAWRPEWAELTLRSAPTTRLASKRR